MRVIYVVVGFRPGAPEASEFFRAYAPALVGAQPVMAPADGDVVVTKKRISAFAGSDLEVLLRANDIRHLVLSGIATSGVVLSTLREAADKDYTLTVLSDLCADQDSEVHRVLLEKVFPRQATVITAAEWIASV
jgi:nicotinamidase-related amidase